MPLLKNLGNRIVGYSFVSRPPTVWNSLDVHTRSADTFLTFNNRLKTELFLNRAMCNRSGAIAALQMRLRIDM